MITLGVSLKPGATLTMPKTRVQARTRSRSPIARFRLARMARPVSRAARVGLGGADLAPDLAERRRQRPVGIERAVAGDKHARADDARHRERQAGRPAPSAAPAERGPFRSSAARCRPCRTCSLLRQSRAHCAERQFELAWLAGLIVCGGARTACAGGCAAAAVPGAAAGGPSRNACHWPRSP